MRPHRVTGSGGERPRPKIGPYVDRIFRILVSDEGVPRKQHHTAPRLFERLREEGYTGGYTQMKEAVRELRPQVGEVHIPRQQAPGEA
jgi:transposase